MLHVPFEIPYLLYTAKSKPLTPRESHMDKTNEEEAITNIRLLNGTNPFNDQIDVKSIIDIKEEWLYNYPGFFFGDLIMFLLACCPYNLNS